MSGTRTGVVIFLIVAIVLSGCVPVATNDAVQFSAPSATPPPSPYSSQQVAQALQESYFLGDNNGYRTLLFTLYQEMRLQDGRTAAHRTGELLDYATVHGADGLEPLILAYSDFVASSNDQVAKSILLEAVKKSENTLQFGSGPNYSVVVPLQLATTPLSIDVRVDAVRAMIEQLVPQLGSESIPTLESLLLQPETERRLCDLPFATLAQQNSDVEGEQIRRNNCESTGSPGGRAGYSGFSNLGSLAKLGCFNPLPMEGVGMAAFVKDIETCRRSQEVLPPDGPVPPTIAPAVLVAIEFISAAADVAALAVAIGSWVEERERAKAESFDRALEGQRKADEEQRLAGDSLAAAEGEQKTAANNLKTAEKEFIDALGEQNETEFNESATAEQKQAARDNTKAKQEKYDKALTEKNKADEKARIAEREKKIKDTEKAAADKKVQDQKPKSTTIPSPQGVEDRMDPACARVLMMGGTVDPNVWRLLTGEVNPAQLEEELRQITVNPDPNSPDFEPIGQALDMPICGLDPTTQTPPASRCDLITCQEGSFVTNSCECTAPTSMSIEQLNGAREQACASVISCQPDQILSMQGSFCYCSSGDSEEEPNPTPPLPAAAGAHRDMEIYTLLTDKATFINQKAKSSAFAGTIGALFSPVVVPEEIRVCDADVKMLSWSICLQPDR